MFEKASRKKLRFSSIKGNITVEDLWDLPLTQLNSAAKDLNKQLKTAEEEDFLEDLNKEDEIIKLKFDIVLHILNTKKDENDVKRLTKQRKEEKEKLISLIAKKDDEHLESLSREELLKKVQELP